LRHNKPSTSFSVAIRRHQIKRPKVASLLRLIECNFKEEHKKYKIVQQRSKKKKKKEEVKCKACFIQKEKAKFVISGAIKTCSAAALSFQKATAL